MPYFIDFIRELRRRNENGAALEIYSLPLLKTDEMQSLVSAAFCECMQKELQDCMDRLQYLLDSNSQSAVIMERWKGKV